MEAIPYAAHALAAMTTAQLSHELAVRGINSLGKKDKLTRRLQHELGGLQRVPTLLYGAESDDGKLGSQPVRNHT